ncbi:endoglucanase II [Sodiomyces alkalinus F11]|uniref:lytic cellulose monooxygenase (C4-dehydrogenating) n=1 Tax=Sodiomyces alkalinus (strain CBS 110278 / VKM F-3762 / F11) TaxID=1314773 RepID=A0A3N2PP54_SODAK|nr:endoglucanase II [Sodiomyces alkalinus F11]ROT36307.1 endoglucanase II [Sodiomyces alkalinus F11]
MKTAALLSLASAASAHYVFPSVSIGGQSASNWEVVRQTANFQSTGPVENVSSPQIKCYELNGSGPWSDTGVLNVQAGASVSFTSSPPIFHEGPALAYLAKVPAGTDVTQWDGSGAVWFKIWQDEPTITSSSITFPTMNSASIDFSLPSCLENGQYLLRVEHIALHVAGAPQFYLSCAQINVSGGSGGYSPAGMLSFPGAYSANDPGLTANIYWPIPTSYTAPGGPVGSC